MKQRAELYVMPVRTCRHSEKSSDEAEDVADVVLEVRAPQRSSDQRLSPRFMSQMKLQDHNYFGLVR